MKLLDSLARKLGYGPLTTGTAAPTAPPTMPKLGKRSYSGADLSRLTADWLATGTSSDAELRTSIKILRDRVRDGERNEDYIRNWLRLRNNNVNGACGVTLEVNALGAGGKEDEKAGKIVETAWQKWGRKEFCTVTRRLSWNQVCKLSLRGEGRDGGALLRKVKGFNNAWGYALQPLEIDHLAVDLNIPKVGGGAGQNEIRFGCELDDWGAAIAYHLWPQHPGDYQGVVQSGRYIRVPADELLHIYDPERVSATVSPPKASSSMKGLKMLRGYQEAEVTAAREAACKGYWIEQSTPESWQGPEEDSQGRALEPIEPGMGWRGEPGEKYQVIDPKHPVEAFADFCKGNLRSIASGLGISYTSLASDLEGVNFSSIRAGLLEEREEWKATQEWFIDELHTPIFEDWLAWSLMNDLLAPLTIADFERLNYPVWTPRRWPWVDPEKDVNAARTAIGCRLTSREKVAAELGTSIEEIDAAFDRDPVTKDIDTESIYAPDSQKNKPKPAGPSAPTANPGAPNGNGNGQPRYDFTLT